MFLLCFFEELYKNYTRTIRELYKNYRTYLKLESTK